LVLICLSNRLLKLFLGHPCPTMALVTTCFLVNKCFPILLSSLTIQFCLDCLTVHIEPTVNLPGNPPFDYGKLTIDKFYDVVSGEFIYPKAGNKTMPQQWTDCIME